VVTRDWEGVEGGEIEKDWLVVTKTVRKEKKVLALYSIVR
jgi:hypothetical protein